MNAARQFVRRRLCCCCYNDAAKFGDQPVVLTRAETVTTQPTSSGTTSLHRLSIGDASEKGSNGTALRANGGAHANSAYSGSIGGDFDEIDLGERGRRDELVLHVPGDRAKRSAHYAQSGQQQPAEGNDDQVVSGVVDMMLDDIYEEKSDEEERSSPVVEVPYKSKEPELSPLD
ncbi:hypothetical protein AAVH_15549 [Aphelenchoides avenae]|nr:hypothetical protein AAVH_15549 [Aphelenchus avenae]